MIEMRAVSVDLSSRPILRDVNLQVSSGELVGLVGRSGSGKSTLLNLIAGLYTPTSGEIKIDGEPARPGLIRGVVFQEESLLGWLSAIDNVLFTARSEAASGEWGTLLKQLGLEDARDDLPKQLSTGMRKRVELARALAADAMYLLADEPFGTLDAVTRRDLWALWKNLQITTPRTGILCTHDPEEAVRLCTVIYPLKGSRPATTGKPIRIPDRVTALAVDSADPEITLLRNRLLSEIA